MDSSAQRWEQLYNQTPLCEVPRHYAGMSRSPFLQEYLTTILRYCPQGGRSCETGIGSGYGAIWLSKRGICPEGIDYASGIVERARLINNMLSGDAVFRVGDLFRFYREGCPRYEVIHHQGVLEHFTAPQIRAALAQQVASAEWVVFSVPSVYYPFEPEFGDERLLPLAEWQHLLQPFEVEELRYYGDPQLGGREHVLCVLRGQAVTPRLRAMMTLPNEPYPDGISAIVHTRNEARHIGECLTTLKDWTDEILVCDMESTDQTVEIARGFTDQIIEHPHIANFDRSRNVSAMRARYRWVFYLDADERVPAGLGPALKDLIAREGVLFEAALVPFRHFFAGRAMQCLYPGYTAPRLLKNGRFVFRTRLHAGADVDGRTIMFPADNPELALVHYSFDSMAHYLEKLNRYTDGEAANMHRDGQAYHWQRAVAHFVEDFQSYYDRVGATRDGVHGFLYSFFSAFYRFEQHAKLYERRFQHQQLQPAEESIPANVEQVLEFALAIARQKPRPQAAPIRVASGTQRSARVLWSGPLFDPSGYGEESRNFLLALDDAGVSVAGHAFPWSHEEYQPTGAEGERLARLGERSAAPGFVQIVQDFPFRFQRHPQAGFAIGRTMFETDRLPADWVEGCNRMDAIWVPSDFNRQSFVDAGVAPDKVAVVPGCLDPASYATEPKPSPLVAELRSSVEYLFLSVFDWTLHKGWDVLLRGFLEAFPAGSPVGLVLKVWSTNGYAPDHIRAQAAEYVRSALGVDLAAGGRIRFVFDRLPQSELLALYQGCDAFVLPSRGEGWGRPYMEAMACGKPALGTNWSGNTAFMTPENSYLIDCTVVPVPETGWREVVTYRGHRWAEPDVASLCAQMVHVVSNRDEAARKGAAASQYVLDAFSRARLGALMAGELARLGDPTRPEGSASNGRRQSGDMRAHLAETGTDGAGEVAVPAEPPSRLAAGKQSKPRKGAKASDGVLPLASTAASVQHAPARVRPAATVRWEGAAFMWHSLAHVNRQIALGLLSSGRVELAFTPTEPNQLDPARFPEFHPLMDRMFAPLSRPADVHVRHFFPPRFERPSEGHLALIQPWEYGYLPQAWIDPIRQNVSEVWCYSTTVRNTYRESGIPEGRLHIIPLGVDTDVFRPTAPPYVFTTEAGAARCTNTIQDRFVFLFVGGSLERKGIDILLEAYQKAFSAYDDVCLVIKDTGTQTVYQGQNAQERIVALAGDPTRPAVIYLDQDLPQSQLAGLYTASNCVVLPYRGEGFCLPALEALACGVPVIVPKGGPTDDFVDDTVGWQVVAERRPFGNGRIGDLACVGPTWMLEVSPHELGRQMRQAFQQRDEARRRGVAGRERVLAGWTWQHTCAKVLERVEALAGAPLSMDSLKGLIPPQTRAGRTMGTEVSPDTHTPRDRRAIAKAGQSKRAAPTLSLCMIVKNEERVLDACLTSVKPHVDEIVLVDTGSTDNTVEIAKAHGVKLRHFPWCDDFSAARNVSLDGAKCDWVVWMDADDTIPEACGKQLREVILTAETATTGFIMQVHIPPAPGDHGFTIVDHVKIFRNRPEHRFEGRIHEQILEPIYRAGGRIERTDLYVVHSGYDYSPEGQKHKRERDLRIIDLDIADRPTHPFPRFNKGMTHHHLRNFDLAIEALEKSLSLSKPHESTVRKIYAMLASCHLERGEAQRAKERIEEGLTLTPRDPELLFRAGAVYRTLGDMAAAERSYLQLMNARETGHIDSLDVSMTGFKAHHNLALLYQDMQRWPEAETQWRGALQHNPEFVPSWLGLADLYLRLGRLGDARGVADALETRSPADASALRKQLAAGLG